MANEERDLFPIRLLRDGDALPAEPTAFVVGRNGMFVKRQTVCFRAVVPAAELPMLASVKPTAEYLLPPIPAECVMQMLLFFRAVYEREHSEAILVISYHARRGTFRLDAPEQRVSSGHIGYDMPRSTEGFVFVGTVHSHGSESAFHSSTDKHDEEKFDGVHLTFGRLDWQLVDIVASLAVGGQRYPLPVERVLAGVRKTSVPYTRAHENGGTTQRAKRTKKALLGESYVPAVPSVYYVNVVYPKSEEGYLVEVPPDVSPEEYRPSIAWSAAVHPETPRRRDYHAAASVHSDGDAYFGDAEYWEQYWHQFGLERHGNWMTASSGSPLTGGQIEDFDLDKESDEKVIEGGQGSAKRPCGWRDPEEDE